MSLGPVLKRQHRAGRSRGSGTGTQTVGSVASDSELRRAVYVRRAGFGLLVLVLIAGVSGALGVREASVRDERGGTSLEVTYAAVTRPGLDTPWSVRVTRADGFEAPITVRTTADWFGLFDENGLDPEPAKIMQSDEWIEWEFDPPDGTVLVIDFDARVSPAVQTGLEATTEVEVEADEPGPSVTYRTRVMP